MFLFIAFTRKQLTWPVFKQAVIHTVIGTSSIFAVLSATGGDPYLIILGMFVESIGLMLLTLPILLPLVNGADMNLIWFGIIVIKLLEIGLITTPIGLNVYVIKGALGSSVSIQKISRMLPGSL